MSASRYLHIYNNLEMPTATAFRAYSLTQFSCGPTGDNKDNRIY